MTGKQYFNAFGKNVNDNGWAGAITSNVNGKGEALTLEMLEKSFVTAMQAAPIPDLPNVFGAAKSPEAHCKVCWDAKAAEQAGETVRLREQVIRMRADLAYLNPFSRMDQFGRPNVNGEWWPRTEKERSYITQGEDELAASFFYRPNLNAAAAYHQALNSEDPGQRKPDPKGCAKAPSTLKGMNGFSDATTWKPVDMSPLQKYETGVDSVQGKDYAVTVRVCNKSLPGHPVEMNEDEKKCWKCGNGEFEGGE